MCLSQKSNHGSMVYGLVHGATDGGDNSDNCILTVDSISRLKFVIFSNKKVVATVFVAVSPDSDSSLLNH